MATAATTLSPTVQRNLVSLGSTPFDLLVVGGGIYGLACAHDAAQRGLKVALIDRGDFGGATSANHLKTGHGGLRSLQTGDFRRARESVCERRALARMAPRLVRPLPFLIPTTRRLTRSRLALRAAFLADALVGYDRNAGVPPALYLPAGRIVPRDECARWFGDLVAQISSTGGALWHDYQMHQAERLTIGFALAAAAEGACLANHVQAVDALASKGRVEGVRARDVLTGDLLEIRAAITLNAAGPGTGRLAAMFGAPRPFALQKALNVVTTRPMVDPALGATGPDGGLLLLVPWRGRAMLGTWHVARPSEATTPGDPGVSDEELAAFLADANQAFPGLRLDPDEVSLVHRGLVPARQHADGRVTQAPHARIIDHADDGVAGAISVLGVKYTTARGVAERSVDLVGRKLDRPMRACRTGTTLLPGAGLVDADGLAHDLERAQPAGLQADAARHLADTYGDRSHLIVECADGRPAWLAPVAPPAPTIAAEIIYTVRQEMACTLVDVLARRTALGSAGHPGAAAAEACADLVRAELGWTTERVRQERAALDAHYAPVGPRDR